MKTLLYWSEFKSGVPVFEHDFCVLNFQQKPGGDGYEGFFPTSIPVLNGLSTVFSRSGFQQYNQPVVLLANNVQGAEMQTEEFIDRVEQGGRAIELSPFCDKVGRNMRSGR